MVASRVVSSQESKVEEAEVGREQMFEMVASVLFSESPEEA